MNKLAQYTRGIYQKETTNFVILNMQREFHAPNKKIKVEYQQATLGENFQPKQFSQEEVLKTIDPKTMVKKEPNYEWKDLPKEGEKPVETHIMHFLAPFPNQDNDIGKEYGFKIKGLEPTRFNDWERRGRCTDF